MEEVVVVMIVATVQKYNNPPQNGANSERGAILILMVILLAALVVIMGMAIDGGLIVGTKSKQTHVSEYVALAALEAYSETVGAGTPEQIYEQKVLAAEQRAAETAGLQTNYMVGEIFGHTPRSAGATTRFAIHAAPTADQFGRIDFGVWHPDASITDPAPCGTSPCFEENSWIPGSQTATSANSVKLSMKLVEGSMIRAIFSRLAGFHDFQVQSESTSFFVPRRGVFVVDLSASIDDDSHPPVMGEAQSSAFALDPAGPNTCPGGRQPVIPGTPFTFLQPSQASGWNVLPPARQAEYACYPVEYTDGADRTDFYLIDEVVAPEPLTSVLSAVNAALLQFNTRAVSGDRAAVIGFDHDFIPQRIFPDGDTAIPPGLFVPREGDPMYDELEFMTQPILDLQHIQRRVDHAFLPRLDIDIGAPLGGPQAMTDMPTAITTAIQQLVSEGDTSGTFNFVYMFSDGLTNCKHGGGDECRNTQAIHQQSLDETRDLRVALKDNNITFNMVLFGSDVAPHTVLYQSIIDDQRCMDEVEQRTTPPPPPLIFIDANVGGCSFPGSPACPWPLPNTLFAIVKHTQGQWIPVRSACADPLPLNAIGCAEDMTTFLNNACASAAAPPTVVVTGDPAVTDGRGRLLCDAQCRPAGQQISDKIAELLAINPYVLVAE